MKDERLECFAIGGSISSEQMRAVDDEGAAILGSFDDKTMSLALKNEGVISLSYARLFIMTAKISKSYR
jgi:hypothetical protein